MDSVGNINDLMSSFYNLNKPINYRYQSNFMIFILVFEKCFFFYSFNFG